MKKYFIPLFILFFSFFGISVYAEGTEVSENYSIEESRYSLIKEKKDTRSISPVIGFNPTDKLILGGAYFFYTPKEPGYYLGTQFMGSTNKGLTLSLDYQKLSRTPLTYEISTAVSNFPVFYYGMGNNTKLEDEKQIDVFRYFLETRFYYKTAPHFSYGPFFDLESWEEKDFNGNAHINTSDDETTISFGLNTVFDNRDNIFSTHEGKYIKFSFKYIPQELSSNTNLTDCLQSEMDIRYFKMILFKNVFAFKLSGGYSNNDPSFPFMYKLGGSDKLRGYSFGRFIGPKYYALQGEYRRMLDKVVSMAIFCDAGDVAYPEFGSIKSTYGFGLRFGLPPDSLMKVRVDFGITEDQQGLFVTFGEAF
ncbi:MAG: hypothetical protein PHX78_10725 [bacterium]|nr:hypothetical protein [bacterium]